MKSGNGTLTLSGASTFTGNVVVSGGTLTAGFANVGTPNTGALGNEQVAGRAVTVNSGATLNLGVNDVFGNGAAVAANLPSLIINGTLNAVRYNQIGALTLNGATLSSANVTDSGTYQNFQFLGTVTVGGSAPSTISSSSAAGFDGNHLGVSTTFNVADATGNAATDLNVTTPLLNQSGNYGSGAGSLNKSGNGTMSLSGTSTYTGSTAASGGTLALGAAGSINGSSGITVNGTGAKLIQGSSVGITPTVTLTNGTLDGVGSVSTVNVGAATGGIVANGNGTPGGVLTIGTLTFAGGATVNLLSSSTSAPLATTLLDTTLAGAGAIVINASNSLWNNGATYDLIGFGTLSGAGLSNFAVGTITGLGARQSALLGQSGTAITLGITGDLPRWTGTGDATWTSAVQAPKNWVLQSDGVTGTDFFAVNDTPLFDDNAAGSTTVTITQNVSPTSTTFNNSSKNYAVSASGAFGITGGLLVKSGTGSLTINTANSYSGGTTLNNGTLILNNAAALGTGALTINGGTLDHGTAGPLTLSGAIAQNWNGDFSFAGSNDLNLGTGAVALNATRTITTNGTAALSATGPVSGIGFGITKAGNGTLILSGANTFSGAVTVNAGNLQLGGVNTFTGGATVNGGMLQLNASQLFTGGVTINGGVVRAGNAGAFNTVAPNAVIFGPATTGKLQIAGNNVTVSALTNDVSVGTPVVENGVAGTATLTIANAAADTYAGVLQDGAVGSLAISKTGVGTLTLTGPNTYTGSTIIGGGTLEIFNVAALGNTSFIAEKSGGVLRIDTGGVATIAAPITLDVTGAGAFAIGGGVNNVGNFAFDIVATTTAEFSGLVSNASGSLVKRGAGSLALTNPGSNTLSNVGGLSTSVQNGTLILNGGPTASYGVVGELVVGDNTPNQVAVNLMSGTLNVGTFTSVGRGNGGSALQSSLNISGGTLNTLNLYTGYGNGVGGYNAQPAINLSGSGAATATTMRLAESGGSVSSLNLSGNSTLSVTGDNQIGFGGKAIVTIADNATLNLGQLGVGYGNNGAGNFGAGVVRQTGGTVQQVGGGGDWRIGGFTSANDSAAYGSYSISGGTFSSGARNFQIGAYGVGVFDISGGVVNTNNGGGFPVIGRFASGVGLVNISGTGVFNQNGAGQLLIVGEEGAGVVNVSGAGSLVAVGVGAAPGNGGGTGGIRLGNTATGDGILNLNGGTVTTTGIAESPTNNSGRSFLYLNGGTLIASASSATFLQGLDNAIVGPGGAVLDSGVNNVTIGQVLAAPADLGVTSIPLLSGGSGYIGQPIVRITGGGGVGASAIAIVDNTGTVTSVVITNPGVGYTSAPTVTLLGGGSTTTASTDLPTLGANVTTGGLTKKGTGSVTLMATNTYGGATNVNNGTLIFGVSETLSALNIADGAVAVLGAAAPAVLGADLAIGGESSPAALSLGAAAVPEPGSLSLLAMGALALLRRRRRE